ncbi:MAG: Ni-sirohydrochlorin a,c-diamide reductive cyclase catalytic subunit [Archaeoglobaceae archaeon]|nr:Ni-sirohydrochlorin a,c-diamide reductive cyclase catalytic subunit [Archaeoglobaceae archaeon]MDW8128202.1 Ni-sirohydrochlorin a,c-diamide reductive cyclase catalytic subunit [Archaeoglobaceae archaeon]
MKLKSLPYAVHPRPNPIAAALYTLRDLNCKHIILHGPAGCNFRALRLLERDGVKIFTTSMSDFDVVLGGKQKLLEVLNAVYSDFKPEIIGVVGTCCTTIIGEDLEAEISEAKIPAKVVCANVSGCGDNTEGAIKIVESAFKLGIIDKDELERQIKILRMASKVERERGVAIPGYIAPTPGDEVKEVGKELIEKLRNGLIVILNAKKETAYLYADIILAINKAKEKFEGEFSVIANLEDSKGLPKVREDAKNILRELKEKGVEISSFTGSLDEYAYSAERAVEIAKSFDYSSAIVLGIPQALKPDLFDYSVGVSSGERTMTRLRELGYKRAVNEEGAHVNVLGKRKIVRSHLGDAIRSICRSQGF